MSKSLVLAAALFGGVALAAERSLRFGPTNRDAFLAVIREGESDDDYNSLVGGGRFQSYVGHPVETGEFGGVYRADGRLTTAAGAYQITFTTWGDVRQRDFSPASQDAAAVALLERRDALDLVDAGKIEDAVSLLPDEWEMFKVWTLSRVLERYKAHGGKLA